MNQTGPVWDGVAQQIEAQGTGVLGCVEEIYQRPVFSYKNPWGKGEAVGPGKEERVGQMWGTEGCEQPWSSSEAAVRQLLMWQAANSPKAK